MDREMKEMFDKVLGAIASLAYDVKSIKSDLSDMKGRMTAMETDMADMKARMTAMETEMADMKARMTVMETDMADMKARMTAMETDMAVMKSRQDEMYLMLKGSEEKSQVVRILEERSTAMKSELDSVKVETAKTIGVLKRTAREILDSLAEEVS